MLYIMFLRSLLDSIKSLLESDSFSYVWDFLKILIATLMGYGISRWSAKRDQSKINKKFKKQMLEFFNALRNSEIFSLFRIISTIDESRFLEVIDGYMKSSYSPEKKSISGSIRGSTQTRKNFIPSPKMTFEERIEKRKENRTTYDEFNLNTRNEQYIMTNNYQNLEARIDVYGYMILLYPVGGSCVIFNMEKSNCEYNLYHQDKNVETLTAFLSNLENQYRKHGVIRKRKKLDKSIIINPRWKNNLDKKPRPLPKKDDQPSESTDSDSTDSNTSDDLPNDNSNITKKPSLESMDDGSTETPENTPSANL